MSTSVEYFDCLISWYNLNLIQYWELSQVPRLILRPDLKARGLLFSSFCWRLLWYEQDLSLTESACFRSVYDNLCLWCSTIYLVVGPEISTSGTLFLLFEYGFLWSSSWVLSLLHHVNLSMIILSACAPSLETTLQVVQILMSTGLVLVSSYLCGSNTVMLGLEDFGGPLLLPYSQISSSFALCSPV